MNKTLQYILIFLVCFAAAALMGRLFKSDEEKSVPTQEQTIPNDSTSTDTLNIDTAQ